MHILTTTAVLAALVAAGWCDAQSTVPRPRPFRPSFPSTPSSFPSTRRPSDELDNTIFSTDSDKNTFPSSGSSDGFFGSGQPGDIFVHNPSSQGFGNPSTSFGTPAPTTFGSQGGVIGQPVFLTPSNVFVGQPNTFSSQGFGQGGLGQGSFGQGSLGQGSFGQGSLGQGSFGQGSFGQGSFGQGSLGQGSFGQGSFGQGSFGQGSLGQGSFGQGGFGQGSFGQGGLGQGSFGQGSFGQPNSFSGQGLFRQPGTFTGQGVFGRPTVFATPVTIGTALPRQGGTTFNTGLGSGSTSGSSGRFPSNTQFGTLNPGSFGGAIPVIVGFTQGGVPVQGFLQGPVGFSQTPSGGFSQVPVNSFGQAVVPLGFNQVPVNSFPSSANVPTVFPPPPVSTNLDTQSGGIFGTSSSDDRRRPSFGSSSSSSSSTGSTLTPRFPLPSRRVFGGGKSGTSSDPSASASSTSTTKTEKN